MIEHDPILMAQKVKADLHVVGVIKQTHLACSHMEAFVSMETNTCFVNFTSIHETMSDFNEIQKLVELFNLQKDKESDSEAEDVLDTSTATNIETNKHEKGKLLKDGSYTYTT